MARMKMAMTNRRHRPNDRAASSLAVLSCKNASWEEVGVNAGILENHEPHTRTSFVFSVSYGSWGPSRTPINKLKDPKKNNMTINHTTYTSADT